MLNKKTGKVSDALVLTVSNFLEKAGYLFVTYNKEESCSQRLRFKGEDERGRFLEFQYDVADGWVLDRAEGSKYWDIIDKVKLG